MERSHKAKNINAKKVLLLFGKTKKIDVLLKYINEVENGDITNREGLAAKIYFRELFGSDFIRTSDAVDIVNSSLNYIYQVMRSKISQEIVAHGYIPSLGIYHCSEYNYFSLADDIIEVYRPILDYYVISILLKEEYEFLCSELKEKLLKILFSYVFVKNTKHKLIESVRIVVVSVTGSLTTKDINLLFFPNLII